MVKKILITCGAIVLLTAVGLGIYLFVIKTDKKDDSKEAVDRVEEDVNEEGTNNTKDTEATIIPTPEITITNTPEPGVITEVTPHLFPISMKIDDNVKYGYIDDTGNVVIEPTFSLANDFYEDLAVVCDNDLYQVIDEKGKVIFENEGFVDDFHNGLAVFCSETNDSDYKYGYINTKGQIVIKPQFSMAYGFRKDGTAIVEMDLDKFAMIDKAGNIKENYELNSKYSGYGGQQDGYGVFTDYDLSLMGVFDLKGNVIFKPTFGEINYLGNDLFAMKKASSDGSYGMLMSEPEAIFNKDKEQLTDYTLYDVSTFKDGYASATDDTFTFFIGPDGKQATTLPKVEGRGTMTLFGDMIKAEIDGDTIYMKKDGTVIWQTEHEIYLNADISVKSLKYKPNKYVVVNYPEVTGLKSGEIELSINRMLKDIFVKAREGITIEDQYAVDDDFNASLINNLLIINKVGYDYNFGAAHGMPMDDYYFFDINTGKLYELKDLFKKDSDYVSEINSIIMKQLEVPGKADELGLFPEGFQTITENHSFKLTKDSLILYFYPYEIAPYAAGFPEFEIPFDELKSILNTEGRFWKAFH